MSPNTAITLKPNYSVTPKIIPPSPGMRFLTAITVIALNALQARAEDAEKNGASTDVQAKQTNDSSILICLFLGAMIVHIFIHKDEHRTQAAPVRRHDRPLQTPLGFTAGH
jgi:hypothetical protein